MKILLGSTSQQKKDILKNILGKDLADIISLNVSSGIEDQPLNEETTIKGATNRSRNAISSYSLNDFEYSVGLEAGLSLINNLYNLVCVATIINKHGQVFVGVSKKTPLPELVSIAIKEDKAFGEVIREYEKEINLKKDQGKEIRDLIYELINRADSFTEAIQLANIQNKNSDLVFKKEHR